MRHVPAALKALEVKLQIEWGMGLADDFCVIGRAPENLFL